ncbi:MAG: outer membrane beta-barrel protein [Candidatus Aminicenantes bacterium]|nr:outer membrane beta-barrel protein [Candidatus Aminicenantes bacterium]
MNPTKERPLRKKVKKGMVLLLGVAFFTTFGFTQIELTAFGLYNLNLSYPGNGEFNSILESEISSWYPEWQAFFSTVLEQKNGIGFGGRIAYNLTPSTGFEASIEYIMAETAFTEGLVDNLQDRMESIGYGDWIETATRSGGNIIRYYGNLVFDFTESSRWTPYATAGLGITQFQIQEELGPEIETGYGFVDEKIHIHYKKVSALTFNGGLGLKTLFSQNIGLRIDARIFICDPNFEQMISLEVLGTTYYDDIGSYIQSGTHVDTNLNIGFFARF